MCLIMSLKMGRIGEFAGSNPAERHSGQWLPATAVAGHASCLVNLLLPAACWLLA
jgi:hypothetical protein